MCSPGFRDYLVRAGVPAERIETLYNWVDTDWIAPEPTPAPGAGPTRFLFYAGNLGYSQGLETLVEAAELASLHCTVRIVGDGNAAAAVRARAEGVDSWSSIPRYRASATRGS